MPVIRRLFALLALVLPCISSSSFAQEAWPNRPIRIVVPTAPGVAPDVFARIYAAELGKLYKVPVTVENKPGAAAILGIDNVFDKAPPLINQNGASNITGTETAAESYDPIGRFIYVGVQYRMF